ncbi:MAG: class 1 fructose-bisphosphatase [Planctomycetota bacterium]
MTRFTLTEKFYIDQAKSGASGDLSTVLDRVSLAGRMIATEIMRAGFVGKLGLTGDTNVQDEDVRALDVISNDVFKQVFEYEPMLCGMASEEMERIHAFPGSESGKYLLAVDPLDGSGNVDADGQIGTIFGIFRRQRTGVPLAEEDFLQPGKNLVAAGYILYGPSTMFVYTAGGPVNGFTLDRSIGTFFLTHPNMGIKEGTGTYSVNEANEKKWDDKVKEVVRRFRLQETECGKRSARYAGALVGDFHRTLVKGGIYMYPAQIGKPEGKLRLLYENAPLAMVCEQAGGMATDGKRRILDIVPSKLHQRTPLYIGSRGDVEEVMRLLA